MNKIIKFRKMNAEERGLYNFYLINSIGWFIFGIIFMLLFKINPNIYTFVVLLLGIVFIVYATKILIKGMKVSGEFEFWEMEKKWTMKKKHQQFPNYCIKCGAKIKK